MRSSPLEPAHEAAGATFTDFAGYRMPVRYSSDLAEHHAVRRAAGVFDLSHMAEVGVVGPDAVPFLDHALAGSFGAMPVGRAKYCAGQLGGSQVEHSTILVERPPPGDDLG